MAEWATFVVVSQDGTHEVYEARFGAVGIDHDLLAGPDVVVPAVRARPRVDHWRGDWMVEAAALFDLRDRVLLFFASEGPVTRFRHRAVTRRALARAWPGWELRWTHDGPADLLRHLGLDPAVVRERDPRVFPAPLLDPDDEEFLERDPLVTVVTVGDHRCHLLGAINDHPVAEGPALLDRLAGVHDHGRCTLAAEAGIHLDPVGERVGWWTMSATPEAGEMDARWPGWTVEFWRDRWEEHARAAPGRLVPPRVDPRQALAELREDAVEHWTRRPGDPWCGWLQAAVSDAVAEKVVADFDTWCAGDAGGQAL
ncbi:hypothetical protein [Streptomyces sp. NBC_00582]|uniref:hypothetical protein n=1 Tax=Streptomyces sp. NBC_00582 TaxID=2975783 RepID=UPI002E816FC7|nr:hypothetical protein [Streptomyces sp. NBC_00582]WUB60076.1 hypothetical protein OG852_06590 [Streptomyces sp. NBC_00582]